MKTREEIISEISGGTLFAFNGDPGVLMDFDMEEFISIVSDCMLTVHTRDNTDEYEWEVMCDRLDLKVGETEEIIAAHYPQGLTFCNDYECN